MSVFKVRARKIFESYGNPTVAVDLCTSKGVFRGVVPTGASAGICEGLEQWDESDKSKSVASEEESFWTH
uniref:Enolase N-terminal domain-containing protein n=1 Tax=Prolemur simus TaxID=1328070 RepID=A0A8C8ZUJ6_PROSS